MSSSDSDTKPDEPARMDGPNAHVVDQLLGNDHRKRSRPTSGSSLDYQKPEDADSLVTPGQPAEGDEGEQQYHQSNEDGRPKIATRARGSSGIPPRGKLQLEDLQGMSEEEVMRALYEDPELAAAAAAAASQNTDKPGAGSAGKTIPKMIPGKRVDGLKERGFPFMQWAVLLFMLGLVIHQLYKSMMTPSTKTRNKKANKAKSGKSIKSGIVKSNAKTSSSAEDVHANEIENEADTTPITKKPEKSPPTLKKKKVKAKKAKVSSSGGEDRNATSVSEKKPAVVENTIQDEGWTTVGKESETKPKVEVRNGSSKPATKPAESTIVQEEKKATEISEFQPVATKSKKKNKNKKKQESGDSSKHEASIDSNGIEGDAALAMQLQQFEQSALQSETVANNVDVWEEVKPKKRK